MRLYDQQKGFLGTVGKLKTLLSYVHKNQLNLINVYSGWCYLKHYHVLFLL